MDFIYRNLDHLKTDALSQGDIIVRNEEIANTIGQAHQYYATASDYTHFVVLTQSCDLVRRNGKFNAPYITIAAAKPFQKTVTDFLASQSRNIKGSEFQFHPISALGKVKQLLERHLHNTESEFFFLPQSGHQNIDEDLVVFLRLTIALRKDHYDAIAASKIAELADVFQAKLGWLKGNIYSRVATPDLEDRGINSAQTKKDFYDKYIPQGEMIWLSALQSALLKKRVLEDGRKIDRELNTNEVLDIIENQIPEDADILAANIIDRMIKNKILDPNDADKIARAKRTIANEPTVKSLVKGR